MENTLEEINSRIFISRNIRMDKWPRWQNTRNHFHGTEERKNNKVNEDNLSDLWYNMKDTKIHSTEVPKGEDWNWSSNALVTWWEEPTHWKRPRCWESLKVGEVGNRGQDGWKVSLTQTTWVWENSGIRQQQGSLAYCSPWDHRVWQTEQTEQQ